jgi:PBSX family phage terminase large subunit
MKACSRQRIPLILLVVLIMVALLPLNQVVAQGVQAITGRSSSGEYTYQPRGAAATVMDATDPEILISGPSRTGKTRGNLEKIHRLMQQYKGARALIVRKTRASLTETALQTFEDHVLGPGHPLREGPQRMNRQSYQYANGSRIVVGGMDKATRIMSSEYDIIYVPEAIEISLNDWESLISRLSSGALPYQQIIADTNPDKPTHWLKQRCDAGVTRILYSDHRDNPVLWDVVTNDWTPRGKAYMAKLERLTGVRKSRLRYGKWVSAEGAIYEDWDEAVHLIDRFTIPSTWARYRVIDFGFTNPFVCQWWAVDPDGRLIMYREIYMTGRTVRVHAAQITKESAGETYQDTIADHDAEDRETLSEEGIATTAAEKSVKRGIEKVQERLKLAGDGRPRLYIMRDSLVERDDSLVEAGKPWSTVEEITGYVWAKASDGKPNKEEPLKLDDHGMDDMRYMVAKLDFAGEAITIGSAPDVLGDYRG